MKIYPREPDLETIYNRIRSGNIVLQPDFQRDLVWNLAKKQSLIDTILREWQFPPVFVVMNKQADTLDVLDGQQRLNAIFEFFQNSFSIDGDIKPSDDKIISLHGNKYKNLPNDIKGKFDRYSIRVYELTDYNQDEPYELFYRLNQGTSLTPAEKRNTFYGVVRDQVRELVFCMDRYDLNASTIGFTNSRLAYHDVIARLIFSLEIGLSRKITDAMLVDFFRRDSSVSNDRMLASECAIKNLASSIYTKIKLNKSTLFTWLYFYANECVDYNIFDAFNSVLSEVKNEYEGVPSFLSFIVGLYLDKSSSSVNDAIPVQIRLLAIYMFSCVSKCYFDTKRGITARKIYEDFNISNQYTEERLIALMDKYQWGMVA